MSNSALDSTRKITNLISIADLALAVHYVVRIFPKSEPFEALIIDLDRIMFNEKLDIWEWEPHHEDFSYQSYC